MLVRRTARHGRRHGLVKEGHRKAAKVEQPCFDSVVLLEVLKNPLRGLFRKPALARAAYDYRDSRHVLFLCCLMRDRSLFTRGSDLVPCEFTFGLEPILQVTAGFFTAFEIDFVCAALDFLLTCRFTTERSSFSPSVKGCFDSLLVLGFDD